MTEAWLQTAVLNLVPAALTAAVLASLVLAGHLRRTRRVPMTRYGRLGTAGAPERHLHHPPHTP